MPTIIQLHSAFVDSYYVVDTGDPLSYTDGTFDLRYASQHTLGGVRDCIIKTTLESAHAGTLSREGRILRNLRALATSGDLARLHLEEYYPEVIETITLDNGNTSLVLSIEALATRLSDALALSRVIAHSRVDPRTAAWILTRLLRLTMFLNQHGYRNHNLTVENMLICPGVRDVVGHKLLVFDWSTTTKTMPYEHPPARAMLQHIGQVLLQLLNGDLATGALPSHADLKDNQFEAFIRNLVLGNYCIPSTAYADIYSIIDNYWGRGFHPYTVLDRN